MLGRRMVSLWGNTPMMSIRGTGALRKRVPILENVPASLELAQWPRLCGTLWTLMSLILLAVCEYTSVLFLQ